MTPIVGTPLTPITIFVFLMAALPALVHANEAMTPGFLFNAETQLLYDDNVYRTTNNQDSDTAFIVKPKLAWHAVHGAHLFDLSYAGDYGRYFDQNSLDYTNHKFTAHALLDHSARLNTDYTLGYERGSDKPGSNDGISIEGEEPDEWNNSAFDALIEYGNSDSHGQLVGRIIYKEWRYTNNDSEFRDYNQAGATGTFYYRLAPRTRLLFELDYDDNDYQESDIFGSNQSNKEYSYLTGLTWEATAKTTGVFKIGYRDKNYQNDRFSDITGLALFLDGTWEPTTHTKVTFGASRDNENSAIQGSGGSTKTGIDAGLEHSITQRLMLSSSIRLSEEDFDGAFSRKDDRRYFALGVKYSLQPRFDIGIEYQFEERDSNRNLFDFTSNIIMLTASTRFQN